ncbi:MAG TPA: lipoprotein [Rhodocyclaceae bacterium]|nr:lipoprotein [Rhodocyclaceae bacterium]
MRLPISLLLPVLLAACGTRGPLELPPGPPPPPLLGKPSPVGTSTGSLSRTANQRDTKVQQTQPDHSNKPSAADSQ